MTDKIKDFFDMIKGQRVQPPASLWSRIDHTLDSKQRSFFTFPHMHLRVMVSVAAVFVFVSLSGSFMMLERQLHRDVNMYLDDLVILEASIDMTEDMTETLNGLGTFL